MESTWKQNRLIILNKKSKIKYLVDTGADVSVLPGTHVRTVNKDDNFKLYAANGSPIGTYGTKNINVNLELRINFSWDFIIADMHNAILEADFLRNFNLLVDLKNKQILDSITQLRVPRQVAAVMLSTLSTINSNNRYANLRLCHDHHAYR